jgi:ABC-2 type transport system permease protein
MIAIYKKELKVYFTSMLGYAVMGVYLLIAGLVFSIYFLGPQNTSDFAGFFMNMNTIFLLMSPVLTLRILAEDKKLGTYELLLTSPVSPWDIIFGKFLGILTFVVIGITILLLFPLILSFYTTVEWGAVIAGYLGILFSMALFISVGMLASSLTDNYVVCAVLSFGMVLLLLAVSMLGESGTGPLQQFFKEVSYSSHYYQFASGLIKLKDLLYFCIGSFLMLFISKSILESKTWK